MDEITTPAPAQPVSRYDAKGLKQALSRMKGNLESMSISPESGGNPEGDTIYFWPPVDQRKDGQYVVHKRNDQPSSIYFVEEWGDKELPWSFSKGKRLKNGQITKEMSQILEQIGHILESPTSIVIPEGAIELRDQIRTLHDQLLVQFGYHLYKPNNKYGILDVRSLSEKEWELAPTELLEARTEVKALKGHEDPETPVIAPSSPTEGTTPDTTGAGSPAPEPTVTTDDKKDGA